MKYLRFTPLALVATFIFASVATVNAQIRVNKVDFDKGAEDWVVAAIDIEAGQNPNPDAPNPRYVDDILVELTIAIPIDRSNPAYDANQPFWFYHSAARIITIETGKEKTVHFFLPGPIVERDNLKETPEYWFVNISVAGEELEPSMNDQVPSKLRDEATFKAFRDMADGAIGDTEGIMLPFYQAPGFAIPRVDPEDIPAYYRLDETR